jgi:DNA replication licensing factor MCM5
VRDIRDETTDRAIAEHVMRLHMGGNMEVEEHYEIDLGELKKYIAYTRTRCSPRLSEAAGKMLENMYVQDRQMTAKDSSAIPITVRQLEAVIRLSESLAKMSICTTVTEQHVIEAHRIFQVSTLNAATLGMSTSGVQIPEEIITLV